MKNDANRASILRDDGAAFHRWGNLDEAEQCYLKALNCDGGSQDHQTLYRMAELFLEKKNPHTALQYYMLAIHADPANLLHKQRFLDIGGAMHFKRYDPDAEDALWQCLKTPDLDFTSAGPMWLTLLQGNDSFAKFFADARIFEKNFDPAPLLKTYFIEGLKKIPVHNLGFEDFIRRLRQWLLMGLPYMRDIGRGDYLRLAEALAIHCFYGDYIIRVSAPEQAKLREISSQLSDPLFAAVYACYSLQYVSDVFDPGSVLSGILKENEQIKIEPVQTLLLHKQEEQPVSRRWRAVPVQTLNAGIFFPLRKEKLERTFAGNRPELLIVGSGTARETVLAALYYPKGKITAIDTSRDNIAYGEVKARAFNIKNVTFRQDDISSLEKMPKPHDIIYSNILHHQQDPLKAWQILRDNLKPAGIMKISLGSKVVLPLTALARETFQKFNMADTRESLLEFRARSAEFLPPETLMALSANPAYYGAQTYKDLLFNPAAHSFTLPEIGEALAALKLSFEGFDLPASILHQYAEKFSGDPDAISLKNWHIFEQEVPDTFAGQYQFWCRKV